MEKKDLDAFNGRFICAMEELGHTGYSLSKVLGTSEAVISNIRNRKNPPSTQLIRELLNKFLELDPDWLLFGRGSMLRNTTNVRSIAQADQTPRMLESIDNRMRVLEELIKRSLNVQLDRTLVEDETISDLEERIASIEKKLARR